MTMPPMTHSVLAPSHKEWIHCPLAAQFLAIKVDEEENAEAAEFGTETHALAEAYIREALNLSAYGQDVAHTGESVKTTLKHYSAEMEHLASSFSNFVVDTVRYEQNRTGDKPVVLVEQRFDMDYAPDTHGTLDVGIISGDTLTVIDNKTGFIKVNAEENGGLNSQLAIYGLYAYRAYKDFYPIKQIRLVIHQERIHNVSETQITSEQLEKWAAEVLYPAVRKAMSDKPKAESGAWCKYCAGKNICRQRSNDALAVVGDGRNPELLTDADIEAILPKLDFAIDYIESVKEYALKKAVEQGKRWSGFKLVESTTKRKFTDEAAVGKVLIEAGYQPYQQKLLSITELQKLVGKAKFTELIGGLISRPKGQPILVPEGDSREEIFIKKGD